MEAGPPRDGRSGRSILENARVRTLDPARPLAEAVGLEGGRIVAVGGRAEVHRALPGAAVRDLRGAWLHPGLIDAHGHLAMMGGRMRGLDLSQAGSPEEIAALVESRAAHAPPGQWIVGRGWDQNRFEGGRLPGREVLAAVSADHPIFLERVDGHAAWVNPKALALAGLDDSSPDLVGGRIVRGADGRATGVLVDAAMSPVAARIPAASDLELEADLLAAARRCAAAGLTAIHDAGTDARAWAALERLAGSGRLPIRVYAMAWSADPGFARLTGPGPRVGLFDGRLTLRAVKFLLDGALGSGGAALFEDYADEPGQRGLMVDEAALEAQARGLLSRGWQLAVHAIGDRAVARALEILERAARAAGVRDHRCRIEHAQLVRAEDLGRFARAGVVASIQPGHATSDLAWVERRLGPERVLRAYPWRALADAGAPLAFGTDFPIEPPDPRCTLYAAVTRQDARGRPEGGWHPEQRLTRAQALEACTAGAAFAAFEEAGAGRVRPGMRADLSGFDLDLLEAEPAALLEARAVLTVVGGEVVFEG